MKLGEYYWNIITWAIVQDLKLNKKKSNSFWNSAVLANTSNFFFCQRVNKTSRSVSPRFFWNHMHISFTVSCFLRISFRILINMIYLSGWNCWTYLINTYYSLISHSKFLFLWVKLCKFVISFNVHLLQINSN